MAMMPRKESYSANRQEETGFTLKEFMSVPQMKGARLLSGDRFGHRPIHRVAVAETPEALAGVGPGELLYVPGASLAADPEWLPRLLPELTKRGVPAIGIPASRQTAGLLAKLATEAEQHGMPLIELPAELEPSDLSALWPERSPSIGTYDAGRAERALAADDGFAVGRLRPDRLPGQYWRR